MDDLKRLLKQSIIEYALVSNCLDAIQTNLKELAPEPLLQAIDEMHQMQEQAKKTDSLLEGQLKQSPDMEEIGPLMQRRSQMLAQILEKNRLIFDQTSGILAVKAAELGDLRAGRTALSGYRTRRDTSGRIVRNSY